MNNFIEATESFLLLKLLSVLYYWIHRVYHIIEVTECIILLNSQCIILLNSQSVSYYLIHRVYHIIDATEYISYWALCWSETSKPPIGNMTITASLYGLGRIIVWLHLIIMPGYSCRRTQYALTMHIPLELVQL